MPRTDDRGGRTTRARIAATATDLFVAHGFDHVTVADVAAAAGVSKVTVFNHFARKEDLFLDRFPDALEAMRSAIRDREPDSEVVQALHALAVRLVDARHPLSGTSAGAVPFFRTLSASPSLVARARELAAEIEQVLAAELRRDPGFDGDPDLAAAFVVAAYRSVLTRTAHLLVAGTPLDDVVTDHKLRLETVFAAVDRAVAATPAAGAPGSWS